MTRPIQLGFLALILLASLYASIQNLISTRDLGSTTDDPVADWELRFRPLKRDLPFERGIVGYISDSDIAGIAFDAANEEGEYVLTQYALAPIVIVKGTGQEWNVGNLSTRAYEIWSTHNHGRFEVLPFRDGLYLLRKIGS
jgi:hypothetical protein